MLTVQAHAKINLSLEIVGKRADGYHDLVSVMQEVTLADLLHLKPAAGLALTSDDPALAEDDNLALKAAHLLRDSFTSQLGCEIKLLKRIPVAAGLGGGSSDAAAVLRSLATLWHLEMSCEQLTSLAAQLGSDVPFFLYGGTCLVEGRGERVTPLPNSVPSWYVLTNPGFPVSTARVFAALAPEQWSEGRTTRQLAADMAEARSVWIGVNTLQDVLFNLYPAAHVCFERAAHHAPGSTMVSGSGPTVLSRFADAIAARRAADALASDGYWTSLVRTHLRAEEDYPCS